MNEITVINESTNYGKPGSKLWHVLLISVDDGLFPSDLSTFWNKLSEAYGMVLSDNLFLPSISTVHPHITYVGDLNQNSPHGRRRRSGGSSSSSLLRASTAVTTSTC